jgi:hypothetical protein
LINTFFPSVAASKFSAFKLRTSALAKEILKKRGRKEEIFIMLDTGQCLSNEQ